MLMGDEFEMEWLDFRFAKIGCRSHASDWSVRFPTNPLNHYR